MLRVSVKRAFAHVKVVEESGSVGYIETEDGYRGPPTLPLPG